MKYENRFYEALEKIFVGAPVEGDGGYVNLLKIKEKYYQKVIDQFRSEVGNDPIIDNNFKENFYELLFHFFEKYFSECGSVYFVKTANYQKVYEKVYSDTRDVVLFWKTNSLYYVKSDILFNSMHVVVSNESSTSSFVFYFDVGELKNKQNNEKKDLVYSFKEIRKGRIKDIHTKDSGDNTFVLQVCYSERGKKTDIEEIVSNTSIDSDLVEKAIRVFEKQTTVDFFINKNAESFLKEQLDLFLHQYLLDERSEFNEQRLSQLQAFKNYSEKLISFIAQFENELVRIWNKPKFVTNSNYVITLDKLPVDIIEKLKLHENIAKQVDEWKKLYFVDSDFSFANNISGKYLHLPIDTKYFKDIELEILNSFDDLDNSLDGRLIHSENYQAMLTLLPKYKGDIDYIYIDPPFNTGKDFDYLDGYQNATWLSIMNDRLSLSHKLLKKTGAFSLHLDRYANFLGRNLMDDIFGPSNYKAEIYWDTCGDTGFKNAKDNWFQNTNCIIEYAKDFDNYKFNRLFKLKNANNPEKSMVSSSERKDLDIGWLDLQINPDLLRYAYVDQYNENGVLEHRFIPSFPIEYDVNQKDVTHIDPIGMIWTDVLSFLYTQIGNQESYFFNGGQKPEYLLARLIQAHTNIGDTVMDYFSGIGTTVAVAKKLARKFIGVEMGEHFYTFYNGDTRVGIVGRMKNVLFGDSKFYVLNPKKGTASPRVPNLTKHLHWNGGGFFKYYDLEQYEDTLRNSAYSTKGDLIHSKDAFKQYVFFADDKFANVIEKNDGDINLNFDNILPNIDLPETISLLLGKAIVKIDTDYVYFRDVEKPIKYNTDSMNSAEKIELLNLLKPLLWWGE